MFEKFVKDDSFPRMRYLDVIAQFVSTTATKAKRHIHGRRKDFLQRGIKGFFYARRKEFF